MTKKTKATKKVTKKVTKKPQSKKATKKPAKKAANGKVGPGRPAGSVNIKPDKFAVMDVRTLKRKHSSVERPGIKRATILANDPVFTTRLETLVSLVEGNSKALFDFLDEKTSITKIKKAEQAAQALKEELTT